MEYVCVDKHHPKLKIWLQFLTDEVSCAMGLDGLRNSHPIEVSPLLMRRSDSFLIRSFR